MQIDFDAPSKIRQETYLHYEFRADIGDVKILFNDPTITYDHLVAVENGNQLLRFQLANAAPDTSFIGDDYVIYPDVLPYVDLCYDLESGKLKETIVINSAEAQKEFTFSLTAENVTGALQADSSIVYTDGEGKQVWKIEAPYATDANGNNVETTLSFSGDTYTMGVLPAEDAVYPVRLDPTVTLFSGARPIEWVYNGTGPKCFGPYYATLSREDGKNLISSLGIYCYRYYNKVLYSDNANGNSVVYFQFYDINGSALSDPQDVVTGADNTGTISVLSNAYTIKVWGAINGTISNSFNIFRINSVTYSDDSSNWIFKPQPIVFGGTNCYCLAPASSFESSQNGTAMPTMFWDAPIGSSFKSGTYAVKSYRDIRGRITGVYVDLYNLDGTVYSSTSIPSPSTAPTSGYNIATTNVTVPEGIARVAIRGTYSIVIGSYTSSGHIDATFQYETTDYGRAKYAITLDRDIENALISPGFAPKPPANGHKIYLSQTDFPNCYTEATKISGTTGSAFYILLAFNADETETPSTECNGMCLIDAPTGTPVTITIDTARSIVKSADSITDTARKTNSAQTVMTDSKRTLQTADNITTDTSRRVIELLGEDIVLTDTSRKAVIQSEVLTDTKRPANIAASAISDTFRRKVASGICHADTKRQAAAGPATAYNSIDCGGFFLWNSDTDGNTDYGPFYLNVGNDDGTRRIKTMTVYCYRKRNTTAYVNNDGSYLNAYYWFLDKNGNQISSTTTVVVDPVYYLVTIPVPADAYSIGFKGQSVSGDICRLRIDYVSVINLATHFVGTPVPMNYCQEAVYCRVPNAAFTDVSDGQSISNVYDAPFGTTFTPGTITVTSNRGMYSYMKYGRVILYNGQGTAVSTTVIGYPATAATVAGNYTSLLVDVAVPAGITRIEVKGTTYSSNSSVSEFPTINFYAPISTPEYGTAKYYTRLSRRLYNAKISPGFKKCPAHPYKTYVAYGADITDNYVEATTVTAPSNTKVWVKICFTANESAIVKQCDNFCFMLPSRIEEDVDVDTRRLLPAWFGDLINDTNRTVFSSQDLSIDTKRSVIAIGDFLADTQRSVGKWISGNIYVDTIRTVIKSIAPTTDSKRQLLNSEDVSTDSKRPVVINEAVTNDTKRRTSKIADFASDAKRVLRNSTEMLADTFRKAISSVAEITDTKRRTTQTVNAVNDTKRKTAITDSNVYDIKRSAVESILLALDAKRDVLVSVSINADTFRSVGEKIEAVAAIDTIRKILNSDSVKNDLLRRVLSEESVAGDVNRRVSAKNSTESDLKRKTAISQENATDTTRKTAETTQSTSDTARKTAKSIISMNDIHRSVAKLYQTLSDIVRRTAKADNMTKDTKRVLRRSVNLSSDAARKTTSLTFGRFDATRKVSYYISIASDTDRKISNSEVYRINVDTKRIVTDTEWPYAEHYEFDVMLLDNEITFTTILADGVEKE